ncbi:unnamed protein product [Cuscuta campestris]|uniref:Uncharacterized protein n=1 Tax=Cuscuta campestris TaxID=132261 RepID=A0A484NAY8_9ASTE|nr:unnamed protein product [Cuscuta campestris]
MGLQSSLRVLSPISPSLFTACDSPSCSYSPSARSLLPFRLSHRSHLKVVSEQHIPLSIDGNSKIGDGSASADRFSQNKMVADFMRFKHRPDSDDRLAELQTAVISYRKKFPWSFLQPFLQVDLVSTIHIADKKYVLIYLI